jgi:probable DNA metabolism protein
MEQWLQVCYDYDGSFEGFLTCVYEAYVHREYPAAFAGPEEDQISLFPERRVETHPEHAARVRASLRRRMGPAAALWVVNGFLTALPEREFHLFRFIALGYERGPGVVRDLTDDRVDTMHKALNHLNGEVHLLKGFVRFSDQEGVLVAEIEPKNRVLPLLRAHFCARYADERFVIYDRTHKEALFYGAGRWGIVPLAQFSLEDPAGEERNYRVLWRRFYDTIAIEGRYNPKCRMTHMPKRYWNTMTEFQQEKPKQEKGLSL